MSNGQKQLSRREALKTIKAGGVVALSVSALSRFFLACGDSPSMPSNSCKPSCTSKTSSIGKMTPDALITLGDGFTGKVTNLTTTSAGIGFTLFVSDSCGNSKSVNLLATRTPDTTIVTLADSSETTKSTLSLTFSAKEETSDAKRSSLGLYLDSYSISCPRVSDAGSTDSSTFDGGSRESSVSDKSATDFKSETGNDTGTTFDGKKSDSTSLDGKSPDSKVKPQFDVGVQVSDKGAPLDMTTVDSTKPDQFSVCHSCSPSVPGGTILLDIPFGTTINGVSLTNGVTMAYTAGSITNFTMTVKFTIDSTCAGTTSVSKSSLTLSMNATPFGSNTQSVTIADNLTGKNIKMEFSATNTGKGMQLRYRVIC